MSDDIERLITSIRDGLGRLEAQTPVIPGAVEELARIDAMVWAMVELEQGFPNG